MAATLLKKFRAPLVAVHAPGTYCYGVTKGGSLVRYTLAGGATSTLANLKLTDVTCIFADATYIWIATASGRFIRYTLATKVNSQLVKFDSAIRSITWLTNTWYIGTADGKLHSYQ
jgi:hypothetical protein